MSKDFKIENWEQFSQIMGIFATVLHRMCVEFDDALCLLFDFSRKARGKYLDTE